MFKFRKHIRLIILRTIIIIKWFTCLYVADRNIFIDRVVTIRAYRKCVCCWFYYILWHFVVIVKCVLPVKYETRLCRGSHCTKIPRQSTGKLIRA